MSSHITPLLERNGAFAATDTPWGSEIRFALAVALG
jgi:hypothetical protein